jgi:hypothetical protein
MTSVGQVSRHEQRPRFKAGVPEVFDEDIEKALRPSVAIVFLRAILEVIVGSLA